MKHLFNLIFVFSGISSLFAQNNINFSAYDTWIGYMNVSELPANGGAYMFGSSWGVPDLKTVIDSAGNTMTLQPNFNTFADNPNNPYWIDTVTNTGNKMMDASTFVEPGATFNGNDLTFSGTVLSNDLDTNYTATFFIKALDPANGYQDALGGLKVFELPTSGNFTVSATAAELASGLIVQYGFNVKGANANPANEQALGSVVVSSAATSIQSLSNNDVYNIYPNPAQDVLFINGLTFENFRIFDLLGQEVLSGKAVNQVDISKISAGQYIIEINSNGSKTIKSFVKK